MLSGKSLIGLRVYNLEQGEGTERVIDLAYNPLLNRITAFITQEADGNNTRIIFFDELAAIGNNAIIIESDRIFKKNDGLMADILPVTIGRSRIVDKTLLTDGGEDLGRVTDLYFNEKSGEVVALETFQGLGDLLTGKKLISNPEILRIERGAVVIKKNDPKVTLANQRLKSANDRFLNSQVVYSEIKHETDK